MSNSMADFYIKYNTSLILLIFHIMFNPTIWNILACIEYRFHGLTKLWCGHKRFAICMHIIFVFCIGVSRDLLYKYVLEHQFQLEGGIWDSPIITMIGYAFYAVGITFVLGSTYQLGIFGTYHGDCFGYLLPGKITAFPFNITGSPMYDGSTLNFIGHAILYRAPVGLIIAAFVYLCYQVSCIYEDAVCTEIYANADKEKNKKKTN
ncbi:MAG: phosphatidylethanolamine N-methyltransferase family protein [archaeon]|nr:phosphatidylethanolamine N-methyltransferase family protein [archaeon]